MTCPANAASQPRIRSSSVAWPTDSWICRAICSDTEDQVTAPFGAGRRRQQGHRLFAHSPGMAGKVELADELPSPGAVLAPDARVAAALGLAIADGGGRQGGTALADALGDPAPLACRQPLGRVPDLIAGLGYPAPAARATAVTEARSPAFSDSGTDRGSSAQALSQWSWTAGTGAISSGAPARRAEARAVSAALFPGPACPPARQLGGGGETPGRADQRPDADTSPFALAEPLDLAVLGRHRLGRHDHDAGVGIAGAGVEGAGEADSAISITGPEEEC